MKSEPKQTDYEPKYRYPYCGSREIYVASWVRMNPPIGETLDMIGDVVDKFTEELLPAWCSDCSREIREADYLPHMPRERWYRTAKVLVPDQLDEKA